MPTREEIAKCLRIAGEILQEDGRQGYSEECADLTAQVEAWRCETCEREYERIHDPMGEIEKVIECPW